MGLVGRGLAPLAGGLLIARPARAAERTTPLAVDERAPDFTLPDQDGTPRTLAELLPTRAFTVVAFYVKAFTGG